MTNKNDDGGPAFPTPWSNTYPGVSLRDYFAGQALMGFCANPDMTRSSLSEVARYALGQADAMMDARKE